MCDVVFGIDDGIDFFFIGVGGERVYVFFDCVLDVISGDC